MNEINKPENRLDAPQKETENKGLSEHKEQIKASREKLDNLNPDNPSEQQKENKAPDNTPDSLKKSEADNYKGKDLEWSEGKSEKKAQYSKNIENLNPDGGASDSNKPLNAGFDNDKFREDWQKDSYRMDDVDYRQYSRHLNPSEKEKDKEPEKVTFSGNSEKQPESTTQYVPTEADKNSVEQSKEKSAGSDYTSQSLEISGKSDIMEAKGESNTTPEKDTKKYEGAENGFKYEHNPLENEKVMKDAIYDPKAVYGFRPSPSNESSIAEYASADWTNVKSVETYKHRREVYHERNEYIKNTVNDMRNSGYSEKEVAYFANNQRNINRREDYKDDPVGLERMKARNLRNYGNEMGMSAEVAYEKYGSWEKVTEKSMMSANPGMDACCGMYDKYYHTYNEGDKK